MEMIGFIAKLRTIRKGLEIIMFSWYNSIDEFEGWEEFLNSLPKDYFSDYEAFTENEITEVTKNGISLKNGMYINFSVCAENFKKVYPNSIGKCVGERDITDWSFTFYADPKPIMIEFLPRNKLIEFISPNDTRRRFHSLQFKINDFGYTTYDMT